MSKKPKEQGESGAEDETGDDGEMKDSMFATIDDVAGKFSQAQRQFAAEIEKNSDEGKKATEEEKRAAEFAERVHDARF
jgi:hypothetical protein